MSQLRINPSKVVVIDANVCIALAAKEASTYAVAKAALARYFQEGFVLYSANVLVTETLFALCRKFQTGSLTQREYKDAILFFEEITTEMSFPEREVSLVIRADQIQAGYGCSRSADCLYIAFAESLMTAHDVVELVTFDKELPKQAARHAPDVTVRLLEI